MSNRVKLPFLVGCDPEFTLVMGKKKINAGSAESLCRYSHSSEFGSIGMDCGMAELRPSPANDIIDLAKNIKGLLKKTAEKIAIFKWDVSNMLDSSGGHIHLALPEEYTKSFNSGYYEDNRNTKIHEYARRMFSFYLPIWLCDSKDTNGMRGKNGSSYGHYGDYRVERKSKGYTFELRTPSAQWLTCPKTTLATFAYLATIHNEIINHPDTFKALDDIVVNNIEEYKTIEDVARNRYQPFLDPLLAKIKRAVKKFELYPKYRKEINWLFNSEKVIAEKEKAEYDVLKGWGLEPKEISIGQLNNKKAVEARMKKFPHSAYADNWSGLSPFVFNDDHNIANWTHELTKRMYAFNWKINRQYIFYGLHKGQLNEAIVSDNKMRVHIGQKSLDTAEKQSEAKHALKKMINRYRPNTNQYLIGLPYGVRKSNDLKFLIELIHFIENKLPVDYEKLDKKYTEELFDLTPIKEIERAPKPPKKAKDFYEKQGEAIRAGTVSANIPDPIF